MQIKSNIDIGNIARMAEIAEIYEKTKQTEKSEKYHEIIIQIIDRHPKNEKMMEFKINSLNHLKKQYKSLETTRELLNLNSSSIYALINISTYLMSD